MAPRGPWARLVAPVVRAAALLVLLALAVLAPARPAWAHTSMVGSAPADGEVVPAAPTTFALRFDERVDPGLAEVRLVIDGSEPVDLPVRRVAASALETDLPPLPRGVYRVTYEVRDPVDLHPTAGSIVFGVGDVAVVAAGASVDVRPDAVDVSLRWAERVGLALFVGGVAVALLVAPRALVGVVVVRSSLRSASFGAALQLVALVGLFVREAALVGPFRSTVGQLLASGSFGRRAVAGIVVAAAMVALVRVVAPSLDDAAVGRWRRMRFGEVGWSLVALAVGACVLVSLAGHSSIGGSFAGGVAVRLLHLLATGTWAGGLVVAVLLRRRHGRAGDVLAAFGTIAAPGLVLTVLTGLLLTGREVATVSGLLGSWFGRELLAKSALAAGVAALGIGHARRRARGERLARRGLLAEAVLAVGVIGGGAALSATPPAVGAYYEEAPAPSPGPAARTIGDVTVKVSLRPNRPGVNLLTATVVSNRKPAPAPIEAVDVELRALGEGSPPSVTARAGAPVGGVVDLGAVQLPLEGAYRVEVRVARPGAPLEPVVFALDVDPPASPRAPTVLSDAALLPALRIGSLTVVVAGLALLAVRWRRHRASLRSPAPAQRAVSQAGRAAS